MNWNWIKSFFSNKTSKVIPTISINSSEPIDVVIIHADSLIGIQLINEIIKGNYHFIKLY
jgi:hypothetical protein